MVVQGYYYYHVMLSSLDPELNASGAPPRFSKGDESTRDLETPEMAEGAGYLGTCASVAVAIFADTRGETLHQESPTTP
jgi:hypothetical protein